MKNFVLHNGMEIPAVGLGTFPMRGAELVAAVVKSIKYGYSSFDTSAAYRNENDLGYALEICGKERKEIFITTKLSNAQQRLGDVRGALMESMEWLKVNYVDLYLMHWPNPETFLDSWKDMEVLYKEGLCRAIGVCNFHQHHIEKLLSIAKEVPVINQIELHPLLSQKPLIQYCNSQGILVQAYSPLARMHEKLINNQVIVSLAQKYNKSVVQIILRWNFQNGIVTIPKTSNEERLKTNIDIFDFNISKEDIKAIDAINENYRVRYNPDDCDFSKL